MLAADVVRVQRNRKAAQWRRVAAFTASGILVLAVVGFFRDTTPTNESLAEHAQSASASGTLPLTELEVRDAKNQLKVLHKKIAKNQNKASKLDAKVAKEEASFKGDLLKAKALESKGKTEASKEVEETTKAKQVLQKSVETAKESQQAKAKFVSNEKPMEKATKLAAHDQRAYRKSELAVADQVAKLSSDPTNPKLRAEVDKLVKIAKTAKATMEADSTLLTNIEKKVASVQVGGRHSYNALREESLSLSKQAEQLKQDAALLSKDAAKRKADANAILAKVEKEMKGPEAQHAEAVAARSTYKRQTALAHTLEKELVRSGAHVSSASAGSDSSSSSDAEMSSGKGGSSGSAALSGTKSSTPKILSTGQSTFLSGLFSNTAPWDKGFHK